ncbi:MAG: D-alanine--D-alanine ligase, partial [Gemmatimonadetes bacterium]|nr:D-alanine--D-alanine ligase [Gemmatimonadota bacterium]
MKITVLHADDAAEDPVIEQVTRALQAGGHTARVLPVEPHPAQVAAELERTAPDLVFNLAESFAGVSALEASVAGLLNLLGLRYTGSSLAGLALAGDK